MAEGRVPGHVRGMTIRQKIRRAAIVGSFALFPVTLYYFSPVLSLQAISVGIVSGSLVIFGALFAVSLFFGRVFCGWACPGAGLQEIVALVRGAPVKRTRINWIKWVVWGPWAATLLFLALRAGGVRVIDFTYQTRHGVSVTDLPGDRPCDGPSRVPCPRPGGGTTRGVPHHLLDGALHDPRTQSEKPPGLACPAADAFHGTVPPVWKLQPRLPDEHRGGGAGAEEGDGVRGLHPLRLLRRLVPPEA